jgi:carbamoyltransferase
MREGIFEDIWVQPAAGDAGGALGAALAIHHVYFDEPRKPVATGDAMRGAYLGPAFDTEQVQATIKRFQASAKKIEQDQELYSTVASALANGKIIGWFQGRMEWGPRALGNRSILGDARQPDMQKRLNLSIKYREGFRPFAPSVLAEDVSAYFEWKGPSPYMLMVANVVENRRRPIPEGISNKGWKEKLYVLRSDIPAVTHLDYSARLQTVHRETNERYWLLLQEFKRQTSYGLLVNTSFNVRGEPIVCTPDDAYRCFMRTEMDMLVMGNFLFEKQAQPKMLDSGAWKQQYGKD